MTPSVSAAAVMAVLAIVALHARVFWLAVGAGLQEDCARIGGALHQRRVCQAIDDEKCVI